MAWYNLVSQPTVDSSQTHPLSDLETPPVITFCPQAGDYSTKKFLLGDLINVTGISFSIIYLICIKRISYNNI